jgi:hypothetical protein
MIRFRGLSQTHREKGLAIAQQAVRVSAGPSSSNSPSLETSIAGQTIEGQATTCEEILLRSIPSPTSTGSRFLVVVVNYNGGGMLLWCVRSCLDEGIPQAQIVVVDNGSGDGSMKELARLFPGVQRISNPCNTGFARAVNRGIRQGLKQTPAEFVLLLNNDARLERDALKTFADGFDRWPNQAIAGGLLHWPNGRMQNAYAPLPSLVEELVPLTLLRLFARQRFERKAFQPEPIIVESVFGACLCARVAMLPRLGLLDEDFFFYFEEVEWCQRAGRMGFEVRHLSDAHIEHGGGVTANRFRGPARVEYQRSKLTFFRKTRSRASYWIVSAYAVPRTLFNALAGSAACVLTLFLSRKLRAKAATYWYVFCWNLLLRPASWGLPGKCPPAASQDSAQAAD